jgi:hypothetical protein
MLMPHELQKRHIPDRRVNRERRASPRYPFTATCDATEPKSGAKIPGRTSDLGRGGCYVDTIGPFPAGTDLLVRINREKETLKIPGRVIFSQPGMGMGVAFADAEPDQQLILDRWIAELSGEPIPKSGVATSSPPESRVSAKVSENQPLYVMNELILLLLQKGVLTEAEGKSLLQKLLK